VRLPLVSGLEVTSIVRKFLDAFIIVMSGDDDPLVPRAAIAAGGDAFLSKDELVAELAGIVANAASIARERARAARVHAVDPQLAPAGLRSDPRL
jgi:DNA-binding NarL/FixJ family response regulator